MKLATIFDDGWELDDGVLRNRQHPDTFRIPPAYQRYLIAQGQYAKLMFRIALRDDAGQETEEVERMWVIVQRRLGVRRYLGILNNDPHCTKEIAAGMMVVFEPKHVIAIEFPENGR